MALNNDFPIWQFRKPIKRLPKYAIRPAGGKPNLAPMTFHS